MALEQGQLFKISLFDLLLGISNTIDLMDAKVAAHHKRVAFISFLIGKELGLSRKRLNDLVIAGMLHDIGVLSNKDKEVSLFQFDTEDLSRHAQIGYQLLKKYKLFEDASQIIRHNHAKYDGGYETKLAGEHERLESQIVHLADRVDTLLDESKPALDQKKPIREKIDELAGSIFAPDVAEAFGHISVRDSFWFSIMSGGMVETLKRESELPVLEIGLGELENIARLFAHIIDFRSRFTATHSSGVATCASALARLSGFAEIDCHKMKIAGYFHDIGKLGVPLEILEKPGFLSREEMNIVKGHVYYTYEVLKTIGGLGEINEWAFAHHEHLDGSGYPFCLDGDEISKGAKILAMADIFTALMEQRPYREGVTIVEAVDIISDVVGQNKLDGEIIQTLVDNLDEVNDARVKAQEEASLKYQQFISSIDASPELVSTDKALSVGETAIYPSA